MESQKIEAARELLICRDADELATRAVERIARAASEAIGRQGRFTIVLSGGTTPQKTYRLLAQTESANAIDWHNTYVFFADERHVAEGDPRSNFGAAAKHLLSQIKIPISNVFPVQTQGRTAAEAAAAYHKMIAEYFSAKNPSSPPRFDLVLLGMGKDGHTASLFPNMPALKADDVWATWSRPGAAPMVDRITLTYPALNVGREIMFLVSGEDKAAALHDVFHGPASPDERPAAGIRPVDGRITWLVDRSAAKNLPR
jgi:6-phosphogluconolactonase